MIQTEDTRREGLIRTTGWMQIGKRFQSILTGTDDYAGWM